MHANPPEQVETSGAPGAAHVDQSRFDAINLLRAVAALLVLLYHVIVIGKWLDYPVQGALLLGRAGWVGVDLFLVISGFVIGLSAIKGVQAHGADFRAGFARRRLARIVPLYLLSGVAFLFLVEPSLLVQPWSVLWPHLTAHAAFVHNMWPNTHGSINGPNWSVALEMQFYLLMGLAAPWMVKCRPFPLLAAMVATSLVWRAAMAEWIGLGVERAHLLHVYTSQLPGVLDAFGLGIALAMFVARPVRPWMLRPSWSRAAAWLIVFAAAYWATFGIYWPRAGYWDQWPMVVLWRTLLALTAASLVAVAITLPAAAQTTRWTFPLRYLGEVSYGIYLWHLPVLLTLMAIPGLAGARLLTWVLIGSLVLAACSWHLMEKPMIDRFRG